MAVTADGKIAKDAKHFPDWTSREDKQIFYKMSMKAGVVIMGGRTFETFSRPLDGRLNVIITDENKYKPQAKVMIFYKKSPRFVKNTLTRIGYKKAILGGGAFINGFFLKAKAVDEIIVIVAPKIFGKGLSLTEGFDFDINLKLLKTYKINNDSVLLHYKIIY